MIPIIEITKAVADYEMKLMTEKITFSRRKKDAIIKIFSKTKIDDITVRISKIEQIISANSSDGHNFIVQIPELKATGTYFVDIYLQGNLIKGGLKFRAENSDFKEKSIL